MAEDSKSIIKNPYDIEININSILGFTNGWEITYGGKEGKKNYEHAKKTKTKIFSIIGNKNRGKSLILSKITKRELPNGYSVTTKGLSIAFYKPNNIALLDSVGFDSPLLELDGDDYYLKSEDHEKNIETLEKLKRLENEIKQLRANRGDFYEIMEKENEFFKTRNDFRKNLKNKDDQLIDLTNQRKTTDYFLQKFIIENANIILLVVGKITINDQLFLNKLGKIIKEKEKNKNEQKIIVLHNLMTMEKIKDVKDYIENVLKKSLTFTLKEKNDLNGEKIDQNSYNNIRYYEDEEGNESTDRDIVHLVMAKFDSEAGNYYNNSAIEYIKKAGRNMKDIHEFDIIDKLKADFCSFSETNFKFQNKDEKNKIEKNMIELVEEDGKEKLKLNFKEKLQLETLYEGNIEFLGNQKFIPEYEVNTNDDDYVIIYLDCPGKVTIENIKIKYPNTQITKVFIDGRREKREIRKLLGNFGSGDFHLVITLNGKDGNVLNNINEDSIESLESGFMKIKLKKNKNEVVK